MSTEKRGEHLMLSRGEESKFLHRLCRHHFFFEVVPVRNSSDEEAVSVDVFFLHCPTKSSGCFSGEPPDDGAGSEVRSTGESSSSVANAGKSPCLLPISIHRATGMPVVCS